MKIGDTPQSSRRTEIGRPAAKARAPESVAAPRPIQDPMSVMGIPEPELTPKVRQALVTLMEEVGRLGGDEFGIILAHTDRAGAIGKAETLADAIRRAPFTWAGKRIPLEVAYGIYTFQADEDPGRALAEAGRAMYAQKQSMKVAL